MYDKYLIRYGDTLSSIASKFNTKESTIMELNNIPFPDMIREGKEIIVPIKKEKYFEYYTIEKGDNLYSIARRYNINPDLLAILNGLNSDDYIYPNQQILIPKSNYSYYVTKDGDTLDIVSKRFNISPKELIDNNDIIYLLEGQLLVKKN
ncbi:MAG: LysM peptidoglycan-binding domain-containing protein [Bacilli bacterium]|jgi:LysM repeat protein|nr:LysM peptidoglycan-binding domain-containing protein [Bacilli bacterium]